MLSSNNFVFIRALAARRDWKSNQSWDYWRSSTWTEQFFFCRTPISTGEPVAEVTSTPVFRVQVVVFRLLETFNSLAIDGEVCTVTPLTQHILTCTDAHSLSAHHT